MKRLVYLLTMFLFLTTFVAACSNATNTASSTDEGTAASDNNKGDNAASNGSTVSANSHFATTDLQGTWNYHGITSGDSPAWLGWFYGQGDFDSSGTLTYTSYLNSDDGASLTSAGAYSVSTDGIITHSTNSTLHGAMNQGKDLIVRTLTWGGTEVESNKLAKMTIFTKTGGTYTTADLQGTWDVHGVSSGDSPQWLGWLYGQVSVDASINVAWLSLVCSTTCYTPTTTLSITSDGIVTSTSLANFNGAMNSNKDLIVATMGDKSTSSFYPFYGYNLLIFQKAGGTFSQSDLTGTWNYHYIATGDSPQWTGWVYGQVSFDSSGNLTGAGYNSDGGTESPGGTFAISTGGVITDTTGANPTFHAVMSSGKDIVIGTMSTNNSGTEAESYALVVLQKAEVAEVAY